MTSWEVELKAFEMSMVRRASPSERHCSVFARAFSIAFFLNAY